MFRDGGLQHKDFGFRISDWSSLLAKGDKKKAYCAVCSRAVQQPLLDTDLTEDRPLRRGL